MPAFPDQSDSGLVALYLPFRRVYDDTGARIPTLLKKGRRCRVMKCALASVRIPTIGIGRPRLSRLALMS